MVLAVFCNRDRQALMVAAAQVRKTSDWMVAFGAEASPVTTYVRPKGTTNTQMYGEYGSPEKISRDTCNGDGTASMQRTAAAWDSLAAKMAALEESFMAVLEGLQQQWSGPVMMQVVEAARPFVGWLTDLCVQLSEPKRQIEVIERAYLYARSRVVPLQAIQANRSRRLMLRYNNALWKDNADIAQLDWEYEDFWARNVDVMLEYERAVREAWSKLTPWQSPPPIVNNTGLVGVGTSFVTANPEALTVAAAQVQKMSDLVVALDAEVSPATTTVYPPAYDKVSLKAAELLGDYAIDYSWINDEVVRVLNNFAAALATGADKYATAEADNANTVS
ncbi:PPE family protein [Mycobacterium haemophilum DSM 44634]